MKRIGIVDANARTRFSVALASVLGLSLALPPGLAAPEKGNLSQLLVAYGFLISHYPDEFLLGRQPGTRLARDMKALNHALDSLGCDVPTRLAFPHRDLIVLSSSAAQWAGFPGGVGSPPEEGTLFVIQAPPTASHRNWVVLSSVAPEETTVFWVEADKQGYATGLVYDTFKKGEVKNVRKTAIGAVAWVSIGQDGGILLREWAEPGSRGGHMGEAGRVFQVGFLSGDVSLKSPGKLPRD
jgi:hypothetical protein